MSVKSQGPMSGAHLFTIRGIPVFANMWFGVLALLFFMSFQQATPWGVLGGLVVVVAMVLSVLVHELGHGFAARRYGLEPRILLHGFGGLCLHAASEGSGRRAWITAAGPLAGFAAALFVVILRAILTSIDPTLLATTASSGTVTPTLFGGFLHFFYLFNVMWSIFNLIPIWPLDGGILFELLVRRVRKGPQADKIVHGVGVGIAAVLLALAMTGGQYFLALIAGLLGWDNLVRLQESAPTRTKPFGGQGKQPRAASQRPAIPGSVLGTEFVRKARAAMEAQRWREAARLMHQMRDQASLDANLGPISYEILGIAYTELEDYEEALDYLERAPMSPVTEEARRRCLEALGRS
jgi:Zn-dependent protease